MYNIAIISATRSFLCLYAFFVRVFVCVCMYPPLSLFPSSNTLQLIESALLSTIKTLQQHLQDQEKLLHEGSVALDP